MDIEVIDSLQGLEALRPEWWKLYQLCPRSTPFQSPQWLVPWTRNLYGGGEIWTLAIRDHQELIGFAPLFCWGGQIRTVSFLGAGISDYGDLLFSPGREADCVTAVWNFLTSRRDLWQVVDLQELRSGSGLLEARRVEPCSVCPGLDLTSYPGSMDRKHRTDVHRACNKLRKQPNVEFALATDRNFEACLADFLQLYQLRWGPMYDSLERFHREMAAEFAEADLLRLFVLRIDDAPAAAISAFVGGSTLYCYLSGFDPALAKLSPGAVLLADAIERVLQQGVRTVDFLRKPESYKYLWGAQDRVNYKLTWTRDATVGSAASGIA